MSIFNYFKIIIKQAYLLTQFLFQMRKIKNNGVKNIIMTSSVKSTLLITK